MTAFGNLPEWQQLADCSLSIFCRQWQFAAQERTGTKIEMVHGDYGVVSMIAVPKRMNTNFRSC
jgi:hypothetical protein